MILASVSDIAPGVVDPYSILCWGGMHSREFDIALCIRVFVYKNSKKPAVNYRIAR